MHFLFMADSASPLILVVPIMRESLLKKKLRLAADLKLLLPVTPEIVDIANTCE